MKHIAGFMMATAAAAVLVGCATSASGPPPAVAAAPPPVAVVPATNNAPAVATQTSTSTSKFATPYGYEKVVASNGDVKYCRNDVAPGSRLSHEKVCMTQAQLEANQNDTRDYMNQAQRQGASSTTQMVPGAGGAMGGR